MPARRLLAAAVLVLATAAPAADLPPHAVAVDRYGTWTCERGFLMRPRDGGFECIAEAEAAREPAIVVSDLPSAGEGARRVGGEGLGQGPLAGETAASPGAQPAGPSLFIQTDQPWTVVLDAAGNPAAVIVGPSDWKARARQHSGAHDRRVHGR